MNSSRVPFVTPMQWNMETSVKSRAAATTVPKESPLYQAAGFVETVGGSSVAYALSSNPTPQSLSIFRILGTGVTAYEAEQMRGAVCTQLSFSGGDSELMLKAGGVGIGKYHQATRAASPSQMAAALRWFSPTRGTKPLGYYQVESEIIRITAMNYSTFTATIARAQLSSTGAAYGARSSASTSPRASTCCPARRALEVPAGHEDGPLRQLSLSLVAKREDVALLGKATQRPSLATTIVCGTAAGVSSPSACPRASSRPSRCRDSANDVSSIRAPRCGCATARAATTWFPSR